MAHITWTTYVEHKVGNRWEFWSQQSVKAGEVGMSDAEYLAALRTMDPTETLRINSAMYGKYIGPML